MTKVAICGRKTRPSYVLFVTAYPTDYGHTVRELTARYEAAKDAEVIF